MTDRECGSGSRETAAEDTDDDGHAGDEGTIPTVPAALRAGAALFKGYVRPAHDPWEAAWLLLAEGSDERLLHGLMIGGCGGNPPRRRPQLVWGGRLRGKRGRVPWRRRTDAAGVDIEPVRDWCRRLATDPETIERTPARRRSGSRDPRSGSVISICRQRCSRRPRWPVRSLTATRRPSRPRGARAREERETGRTQFAELLFAFRESSPTPHRWPRGSRITWNWHSGSGEMSTTCFKRAFPVRRRRSACRDLTESWVRPEDRRTGFSPPSAVGLSFSPVSSFGFPSNV